jgi:hypothetical protein
MTSGGWERAIVNERPIRVGDVVVWHEITCEWTVVAADRTGLTIEADLVDGEQIRTLRRRARRSECRRVGEQLAMELE